MAHAVKCCFAIMIPRTHLKKKIWAWWHALGILVLRVWRQADPKGLLASNP